jgi:hypothetical protein
VAEPHDAATFLEDVSAIAQTQYFPDFTEESPRLFGSTTNRLFDLDMEAITGVGKELKYEFSRGDNVRANSDPLGSFAAPDAFVPGNLTVRFNKQTTSANDFTELSASCQVDDIDIQMAGKGSIIDYVERIGSQIMPNYDNHMAILRHLPRTAVLGTLSGAVVARNDRLTHAQSTATASNTNGLRAIISGGSIAALMPGTRISFLNPTTFAVNAGNVAVTDTNPADRSFGVAFATSGVTAKRSTGNLANVGTADLIVFGNADGTTEYGKGLYSMGAYFARPAASGDSFIGGVDRNSTTYRWLNPTVTREGSSSATISKSMFNDQAIAMGFRQEAAMNGMVWMTDPTIGQALRDEIGEDAFIQIPVDDSRAKRFANFGLSGLNYQHSQFGICKIESDPLCPPNVVRVLAPGTWKGLYYGWKGLRPVESWYRMNDGTPNAGRGKIWKRDYYALQCDWCIKPWLNGAILNVTA